MPYDTGPCLIADLHSSFQPNTSNYVLASNSKSQSLLTKLMTFIYTATLGTGVLILVLSMLVLM